MKNKGKILLLCIIFITAFSAFIYGENFFYAMKTYMYKNESAQIKVQTEMNKDIEKLDVNFVNKGSCEILLRACIFVYVEDEKEESKSRVLNKSSINLNYGEDIWKDFWYEGNDDYIYYTGHLGIDEKTEAPLIKSIKLNLSSEEKEFLQGKDIKVDIITEAVQRDNSAYKYEWGIEDNNLDEFFKNEGNLRENNINNYEGIKVIVE